ncbi:DUF2635 domain-containing protein [Deltaproteobacteria bacterium OttesenSCG-928-M10]|nr:DUF2635 domain-containing protein [Deltaproteobacteria bacterium OttesenSCG-928-M10]
MKKIYLIPRQGLSVPDPEAQDHLPAGGREVADSPYWRRRLRDKDVTVGDLDGIKKAARVKEAVEAVRTEEAAEKAALADKKKKGDK